MSALYLHSPLSQYHTKTKYAFNLNWATLIDIRLSPTKVIGVLREPGLEYGGEFGQPTHHHAQGSDLVEVMSFSASLTLASFFA